MAGAPERRRARLLVLGAGPAQVGLLEAARRRDLFVIAADRDAGAPGFGLADRRALVSVEDEPVLERLAVAEAVDGVVAPGIDWPVLVAARIAERLRLPHPLPPCAAALATSKIRQRRRLAELGIPQPRFQVCTTVDDVGEAIERVGLPCVIKAPDRQGQRGLSLVRTAAGAAAAAHIALAASRSGRYLVEELVPGAEITVNGFSSAGRFQHLTVTDRVTAGEPAFGVALAHVWPAALDEETRRRAVELSERAVAALGIASGPSYTQLVVGGDGPRVIEVAARLGGGHDAEVCEQALGVDLHGLAIAAALGEEIRPLAPQAEPRVGGACVRFLVAPPGLLVRVTGEEDARGVEGVRRVRLYRSPGHVFGPLRRGADRAGAVLAVGASPQEALELAARAADSVRFETVDAPTRDHGLAARER